MKSSCGWMKACLIQHMFCSREFTNYLIEDYASIVPDSDPNSSDTKVLSVQSNEVSSDHTDLGVELDDNGPNTVNDATVTANTNISS